MAELIGGSGYDDVQATQPSNPSIGDTWLDTSGGEATGKIYADLGNGADWQVLPVQDELQSGRTRKLLLQLQDKPVPEVVDPLNIQPVNSDNYSKTEGGDYALQESVTIDDFEDGDANQSANSFWSDWGDPDGVFTAQSSVVFSGNFAGEFSATNNNPFATLSRDTPLRFNLKYNIYVENRTSSADDHSYVSIFGGSNGNKMGELHFDPASDAVFWERVFAGTTTDLTTYNTGTWYSIEWDIDWTNEELFIVIDGVSYGPLQFDESTQDIGTIRLKMNTNSSGENHTVYFDNFARPDPKNEGEVTDQFGAPTTDPAEFKAWNAIQARDVTTGGSTSADPVEFEILDSTDTALNSTQIPKARIADEPFVMRNRVYSESATSDGQSDYTIATTGDGGHFGIPVLTVVSVKKNGSVLDSANWSFDPDTDTVTIDTSNVTIASGDTIDIKYDFDVFDSTLQPRAYLSRESTSETSPSISHFRYEYVI